MFENLQKFLGALNSNPDLAYAFSVYTADAPHVFLDIDRNWEYEDLTMEVDHEKRMFYVKNK